MATQQNEGKFPFDPLTPVGQLRSLIGDKNPTQKQENGAAVAGIGIYMWYSDQELELMLVRTPNMYSVAADILYTVAASQVLLLKSYTSADLSVRGDAIAAELRLLADRWRDRGDKMDEAGQTDFVQVVPTGGPAFTTPAYLDPDRESSGYVVL